MGRERVVILGAGFAGLELATRLSESVADDVEVTLIDQNETFFFGYSKLDVLFAHKTTADILLHYSDISTEGVEFRRERVTSIDPDARRVETDQASYDADVLVVALGADYDLAATPGFAEGGFEYYSLAGAERLRDALPGFESGTIVIGILGQPFKCPPAPFEGALLLHDYLVQRGIREAATISVIGPMSAPLPISRDVSQAILEALQQRGIEYVANQHISELDTENREVLLADGGRARYDLFIGIPVHRVPEVVETSGLALDGWIPVDSGNLATRFANVYAVGDVAGAPVAKAGVFAESAARIVADDIAARLRGGGLQQRWEGSGSCYIEFGAGAVAKVEASFLGGPAPTARLIGPSPDLAAEKERFGETRRRRWFGRPGAADDGELAERGRGLRGLDG